MEPNRSDRFADRAALITGGTRGIGLAVARQLTAAGARVVLVARDRSRGTAAAAAVPAAEFVAADVRVAGECERAVATILDRLGRLDVLVNNAGVIYRNRTVDVLTEAEWDETFDVNVKGAFLMSRAALPALRAARGTIVNVSSYVGLVGFAGAAAYAASKAALINLTRSMALDHAREGIRVNAVCPGSVDTDMIHAAWQALPDPAAAAQAWAAKHPLGRIATPEEVAAAIVFLASDDARFITGVALPVDGGITAA
ncbi:MAG: SDR family oxidoreductase [Gemmatimonadota bacterium]|nr:SDR family oxidoreductase [Gemmatimonadota bacterium]MDH4351613.1 SDR family oxidoreductase [Gemmatimonadota bacterium]MDH5198894.1 SDR family oxidoreductase [Gemmatimonadota bacterium]